MIIVALRPEHLNALRLQAAQAYLSVELTPEYAEALHEGGPAYTGLADRTRQVIACAGLVHWWAGRAQAWALLAEDAGRHMLALHRAVQAFLDEARVRRIETTVDTHFAAGHRWARLLGFTREGTMRAYTPDGRDADLYARTL